MVNQLQRNYMLNKHVNEILLAQERRVDLEERHLAEAVLTDEVGTPDPN